MEHKFFLILLFIFASANSSMIYRRYEKEHKNYVQIVEVFGTKQRPAIYTENEKALNDFLGRDAFKTDMNCTEEKTTEKTRSTSKSSILSTSSVRPPTSSPSNLSTTKRSTVILPTTVYMDHMATYSPPPFPKLPSPPTRSKSTTTRQPNLDNLFTIRSTKPTIKSNPKQNENPDYTELFNWSTTTKIPNTPIQFPSIHVSGGDKNNVLQTIDDKKIHNSEPINSEYSDNENEYVENNYEEYEGLPPADFDSDEDDDTY